MSRISGTRRRRPDTYSIVEERRGGVIHSVSDQRVAMNQSQDPHFYRRILGAGFKSREDADRLAAEYRVTLKAQGS